MLSKSVLAFCLALITLGTVCPFLRISQAEEIANVYIDPPLISGLAIGDNFTININVANVSHLAGWEIQIFYSSQVLAATAVAEGPFLKSVGNTFFPVFSPLGINNNYNSTHGRVYLTCAILGQTTGNSGSGILANVTFQIVTAGYSTLVMPEDTTKLLDNTFGDPQPIPHTITNGIVAVVGADIAVTEIRLSKTITNSTLVTINVTVANFGNFTASSSVVLYYDSNEIGTQAVTDLGPSASVVLTFTWDTTTIPKGNYTISAYAPPVVGENNIANNRLIDGWIKVTILGDVTGDGNVDILDIFVLAKAFGSKIGESRYDPNADLDNNGEINILDIFRVAKEFGKKDP
jgi:hypothetical protein